MATYEYKCPNDGELLIIERSIDEKELIYTCETCDGKMERVWHSPAVKFNASGFYSTGG